MTSTDVLVVGAGPGGCAAALAFAQRGASVGILDPHAATERGLRGEWLHPAGVAALGRLGVELDGSGCTVNRGFIFHPGDGPPIQLPYPQGTAVSMPHARLTRILRDALARRPEILLPEPDRMIGTNGCGIVRTTRGEIRADLIVGADGRSSAVRRALCGHEAASVTLSHMAGVVLRDAALPVEGYAHVFLGAPGPILAYRLTPEAVRVCFDLPMGHARPPAVFHYLKHEYACVLPEQLREACLPTLTRQDVQWATNRFRRRRFYGRGRYALVGDAVGHGHPLAAAGMSAAILDGESLARHNTAGGYARDRVRQSWAAERLGIAAHRALTADDPASLALRRALFELWRGNPRERERMMALLGMTDQRRRSLAGCVGRVALTAAPDGPVRALGSWMYWLHGPHTGVPPGLRTA